MELAVGYQLENVRSLDNVQMLPAQYKMIVNLMVPLVLQMEPIVSQLENVEITRHK